MRALIMAGGAGSRLDLGEKPLILVCDRPMIAWVTGAFRHAGCEPVVAISPRTPMTTNWCRAHAIPVIRTDGIGYIDDMVSAARHLDEEDPFIVSVTDIPCVTPSIITRIVESYPGSGKEALSTWVPAYRVRSCRNGMPYHAMIDGVDACPAGINILRGDRIGYDQEESALLLDEPRLALNVNTRDDLARAESCLRTGSC